MRRNKALIVFLTLIWIMLSLNGCLDKTGMDYLKIKYLLKDLFSAYHEMELDEYMSYWSLFSPYVEEERERARQFFSSTPYFSDIVFGYYVDKFYYYDQGDTLLEFTYIIGENIKAKGKMILRKEGDRWKVWKIDW